MNRQPGSIGSIMGSIKEAEPCRADWPSEDPGVKNDNNSFSQTADAGGKTIEYGHRVTSLMHLAAENGHADVLRHLLSRGDMDTDTKDSRGYTPVQLATSAGNYNIVQVLINHGARVVP